ncbi:MAG: hypothetical protein KF856_13035 [Cyclobacteriaceae bacterium]|jgi:hypothetical protein|nr:hypothetical protein [Cyclobacteriaceae bacterium]
MNRASNLNQENELRLLLDKIRANSAVLSDYQRYEQILGQNGTTSQQMEMLLRRNGFFSIEQYYNQRTAAKTLEEKRRTDGEFLGAMLGIGGGLLLLWALLSAKR